MKAAVAGGGIAGLSAAIALRNEGWQVDVYERNDYMNSDIGNGMGMGANAQRLLEHWNVNIDALRATQFMQERHMDEATGEQVHWLDHEWTLEATGYKWLAMRRMRLYRELHRVAVDTPKGKRPIGIHISSPIVNVDCEAGKCWTEKGEEITADVIVVADGVFSKLMKQIDPSCPPLQQATTMFRMELDRDALMKDSVLNPIFKDEKPGFILLKTADPRSLMLVVPPTDEKLYTLLMHPDIRPRNGSESKWDVEATMAELEDATKDTTGIVKRIVAVARKPVRWTLNVRDPVATFHRGRAVAIGDSAHPQSPLHGQGATSAMEDAAALAIFLNSPRLGSQSLETRMKKWNDFRYGRACTIQQISINGGKPLEAFVDVINDVIKYRGPMPANVDLHDRTVQEFFFNYDVRKEAEAAIDREMQATARPEVVAAKLRVPHQRVDTEFVHRL